MNRSTQFGFEELTLGKKTKLLKQEVCDEARNFPASEKFRLTDQVIRSVRSVNALIAEGHGRFTRADQLHFLFRHAAPSRKQSTTWLTHLMMGLFQTGGWNITSQREKK